MKVLDTDQRATIVGVVNGPKARRGHARTALIGAARQRFEEVGFAGATTIEIAERAGVSETLIFRYFGSKTGLFVEAVLTPMAAFVGDLAQDWEAGNLPGEQPIQDTIGRYIDDLAVALPDHGALARATVEVIATRGNDPEIQVFRERLSALFDRLAGGMETYQGQHGLRDADPDVLVRIGFLVVGAVSALLPLTYPPAHGPVSPELVKSELTDFILHGLQPPHP